MGFDDGAGQIKSQPGTLGFVDGFGGPIESIEDMGHIFRVDPGPFVADADHHLLRTRFPADTNFSVGSVFDRVGDQIRQNLANPRFVGEDNGECFGEFNANLMGACLRPETFREIGSNALHRDVGLIQTHSPGL